MLLKIVFVKYLGEKILYSYSYSEEFTLCECGIYFHCAYSA